MKQPSPLRAWKCKKLTTLWQASLAFGLGLCKVKDAETACTNNAHGTAFRVLGSFLYGYESGVYGNIDSVNFKNFFLQLL